MIVKKSVLKEVYKKRGSESHKYDFGNLLVIGGSEKYSGSPAFNALSALAAYRSGVDLVEVIAPKRAADIIATFSPDLITIPVSGDYFTKEHLDKVLDSCSNKSAAVVGGGIGREKETAAFVLEFLENVSFPVVIDADGVYAAARDHSVLNKNHVITPHAREFTALTGINLEGLSFDQKKRAVKDAAMQLGCVIILKGALDIISDGYHIAVNKTGNVYMTKGGTGDVLAGICGSLLAQGVKPFTAACASAYINGRAGDIIAKKKKQSLLASDMIKVIEKVIG